MDQRYQVRCTTAEAEAWCEAARDAGHTYLDDGSPGPIARIAMIAYTADSELRARVASYYETAGRRSLPEGNADVVVVVRCGKGELAAWRARAALEGHLVRGQGAPAQVIRRVLNAYVADAGVRAAIEAHGK